MTAQPLRQESSKPSLSTTPGFEARLQELGARYVELWRQASDAEPILGERQNLFRQWSTYRRARRLVETIAGRVESLPPDEAGRDDWRREMEQEVRSFGAERLAWPDGYGSLLLGDEFFETTVEFVRAARRFDPRLETADIGQALRNVWIVNSIQMLLDLPVAMTPAIFAYSLLYPYTDNYLDDAAVDPSVKRTLVERLGRRLAGESIAALDPRQRRIFELVGMIENEFDRVESPDVFSSLLEIHRAQVESLAQQGRGALSEDEILAISVAKGGASVLADGYLAAGELEPDEADFCFGYGVFLQLLDDLQDARPDHLVGHRTIFSGHPEEEVGGARLDQTVSRLYELMHRIVQDSARFTGSEYSDRKDLVLRNCSFLLVGAVAENTDLFGRGFVRRLEIRWPLRFRAMGALGRRARKRLLEASRRLCERRGVESVLDLL